MHHGGALPLHELFPVANLKTCGLFASATFIFGTIEGHRLNTSVDEQEHECAQLPGHAIGSGSLQAVTKVQVSDTVEVVSG